MTKDHKITTLSEFEKQLELWRRETDIEKPEFQQLSFYTDEAGNVEIEVFYERQDIWMNQKTLGSLFDVNVRTVNEHLQNIYSEGELLEEATIRKIRKVQKEGNREVNREVKYYNLDAVISVGYRVNSLRATQFRKFSTRILHEYIEKGYALNDIRFKQGNKFDSAYFEEMLERIRDIRLSERMLYLQVTDIFALASDYDKNNPLVREFFAFVQNKLHWALTGETAAEIIWSRVDSSKPFMGLTNWSHFPSGKIYKTDVTVAKNYLLEDELHKLRLMVNAFLDLAQMRAERHLPTSMQDWIKYMNDFLNFTDYPILDGLGKKSKEEADIKALEEYEKYRVIQDNSYKSDFEQLIGLIPKEVCK